MAVNPSKQGGAINSQAGLPDGVKIKKEDDGFFMGQHNHKLSIQFKGKTNKHTFTCTKPQTVLEAIRTREEYKKPGWSDDRIVIQWGREDKENIIPTHFPCTCIEDNDTLIVSKTKEPVEERRAVSSILPKDEYSVFFIDTLGGTNAKMKKLFKSSKVEQFKFLCVYGEKNITVREALERDGRFVELRDFKLTDNSDPDNDTQHDDTIDVLNGGKFKIRLPKETQSGGAEAPKDSDASCTKQAGKAGAASARKQQKRARYDSPRPSGDSHQTVDITELKSLVKRSGFRVEDVDLQEIMKKLREQFPALKKQMEDRFPGNKFQEALNLKKENFGKIQKDFRRVSSHRKLLEMGKSVCKVVVEGFFEGTGFVLVDNFIMTNAHLFGGCTEGNKLKEGTNVYVLFNYEDPPLPDVCYKLDYKVEELHICFIEDELDYAVLKVSREGETCGSPSKKPQKPSLPPGLLKCFGEMPKNGGACIIGHPNGEVKQIDLTCVIEQENREQAVNTFLYPFRESLFILCSLETLIKAQGIEKIMMGGPKAEKGMTYNTFMYHGASGSPVFDAQGRVCAIHTAGYVYGFPKNTESVIEFGQSLENIVKHLVKTLTIGKDQELLGRIWEVSDRNPVLKKVLESVYGRKSNDAQLPDSGESMDTN